MPNFNENIQRRLDNLSNFESDFSNLSIEKLQALKKEGEAVMATYETILKISPDTEFYAAKIVQLDQIQRKIVKAIKDATQNEQVADTILKQRFDTIIDFPKTILNASISALQDSRDKHQAQINRYESRLLQNPNSKYKDQYIAEIVRLDQRVRQMDNEINKRSAHKTTQHTSKGSDIGAKPTVSSPPIPPKITNTKPAYTGTPTAQTFNKEQVKIPRLQERAGAIDAARNNQGSSSNFVQRWDKLQKAINMYKQFKKTNPNVSTEHTLSNLSAHVKRFKSDIQSAERNLKLRTKLNNMNDKLENKKNSPDSKKLDSSQDPRGPR
ncbi:MAG: hypothetical protein H0U75_00890 [Legionella sp.]|nr:hypothetical protein [Legionella sp.]